MMTTTRIRVAIIGILSLIGGVVSVYALSAFRAQADGLPTPEDRQRCAIRMSSALLGKSPSSTLLNSADPQADVEGLLTSADFITRFSGFVNASFNDDPGANPAQDAPYFLAKYVLENNKPWKELYLGQYSVDLESNQAVVKQNSNGVGFFRSPEWLKRYAGNELAGYKLTTAYRLLNNVIGLKLVATTNAPTADVSATGRQAPACRSCHYDNWYALDKLAKVLTRRVVTSDEIEFSEPPAADLPQTLEGDIKVSNDKELITALVNSIDFKFHQCRLAFRFLYGRAEHASEGEIFDKCMSEFSAKGTIQSAIAVLVKDSNFCR